MRKYNFIFCMVITLFYYIFINFTDHPYIRKAVVRLLCLKPMHLTSDFAETHRLSERGLERCWEQMHSIPSEILFAELVMS